MSNEITLPLGASAEPDTCGSCKFFQRMTDSGPSYAMEGRCRFKLPKAQMERFALREYRDNDEVLGLMTDTDRCDLYRPDGKVYIVQRRIPPLR